MKKKNIVLTGFMGTGKSTVGRLLAPKLQYSFVDTDNLIEEKCGMSIPAFFKLKGEAVFRQLENNIPLTHTVKNKTNLIFIFI